MSDTTVEVLNRVIALQPARLLDVDGYTYIDKDKNVTLFQPPVPDALHIHTLSGFVALLENGFEGFDPTKVLIQVADYNSVELLSTTSDRYGRRQRYVVANALKPERQFNFNTFLPQETFNIALRSMFVDTPELQELLAISGNLTKETEVRQQDDGITQDVTVRGGVRLVKEVTIKPRITLKPFRTFTEVDQPSGDFIFRVSHDDVKGNTCALFEADAGAWKITAMKTIKSWLENSLVGASVESVNHIPVIA